MTETTPARIAGRTLAEWQEFARRDDCLERMVPSDLRQLVGAALSPPAALSIDIVEAVEAEREALREALERLENANEAACAARLSEAYYALIKCPGMSELLIELDDARLAARRARSAIRARPSISKVAL